MARRQWSVGERDLIVQEYLGSGLSLKDYGVIVEIGCSTLSKWVRQHQENQRGGSDSGSLPSSSFVELVTGGVSSSGGSLIQEGVQGLIQGGIQGVEIGFGSGVVLKIGCLTAEALVKVVQGLWSAGARHADPCS